MLPQQPLLLFPNPVDNAKEEGGLKTVSTKLPEMAASNNIDHTRCLGKLAHLAQEDPSLKFLPHCLTREIGALAVNFSGVMMIPFKLQIQFVHQTPW